MSLPILFVDDDDAFRNRMIRAISNRGLSVLGVPDGASALSAVRNGQFSGVIADLRMPGIPGLDLVRELLALKSDLPIVLLTGFGSIASAIEAVRLGARDYLTKPVDPDQLIAALRSEPANGEKRRSTPGEVPSLDRVEWEHIQRVLAECQDNISHAARLLGLDRRTLQRKLAKYPPRR